MTEHLHILEAFERIGQDIPLSVLFGVTAFCEYAVGLFDYKSCISSFLIETAEICGDTFESLLNRLDLVTLL